MYKQISEDIAQEYYQQNFSNDGQRFVAWYLRNIHLRDLIQTRDDITDGADDKQIDAISSMTIRPNFCDPRKVHRNLFG